MTPHYSRKSTEFVNCLADSACRMTAARVTRTSWSALHSSLLKVTTRLITNSITHKSQDLLQAFLQHERLWGRVHIHDRHHLPSDGYMNLSMYNGGRIEPRRTDKDEAVLRTSVNSKSTFSHNFCILLYVDQPLHQSWTRVPVGMLWSIGQMRCSSPFKSHHSVPSVTRTSIARVYRGQVLWQTHHFPAPLSCF